MIVRKDVPTHNVLVHEFQTKLLTLSQLDRIVLLFPNHHDKLYTRLGKEMSLLVVFPVLVISQYESFDA